MADLDTSKDMRGLRDLLLKKEPKDNAKLIMGEVASIDGGGNISVFIEASDQPSPEIRYLSSYTPVAGDIVVLLKSGPDVLCLGDLA